MRRAYKFRLWTNANQERELAAMLETHRRLYNACLDQRKARYEAEKVTVKYAAQSARFKAERATNPFYARLNFSSAQATMRRLDKSFANFFRRVKAKAGKAGYPRFRGRDRYDSVEFPAHGDGIRLTGDRLRVQHVGVIRVKLHREVQGTVKTVTLKRVADKWYVVLSCDLGDVAVEPSTNPPVGIDVGLEKFLSKSDGTTPEPNPRYLKDALPELRRKQRACAGRRGGQEPPQGAEGGRQGPRQGGEPAARARAPGRLEVGPSLRDDRGREPEHQEHARERPARPRDQRCCLGQLPADVAIQGRKCRGRLRGSRCAGNLARVLRLRSGRPERPVSTVALLRLRLFPGSGRECGQEHPGSRTPGLDEAGGA